MASRQTYRIVVTHDGLNKYRVVKGETYNEASRKADALKAQWDAQWDRIVKRQELKIYEQKSERRAELLTLFANKMQEALDNILLNDLYPQKVLLSELKDNSAFKVQYPETPHYQDVKARPYRFDEKYNPKLSWFKKLLHKFIKAQEVEFKRIHDEEYEKDLKEWENEKANTEKNNLKMLQEYNENIKNWTEKRNAFEKAQNENNQKTEFMFKQYKAGNSECVEWYFNYVLRKIKIPFKYEKSFEIEYNYDNKSIIIDLVLPAIENIPKLKNVTYIKSRKELKKTYYNDSYLRKKYDSVIYQIVLQTLNYIFAMSKDDSLIETVVINGKVKTIDKSIGKSIEPYILSVRATRKDFEDIDLDNVDPKAWFKSSKGISAPILADVTPVAPVLNMKRTDNRFIEGYDVADSLDDSINLAAIDWQDFENLIREIFEKEFNANGGEVRITQASRDGGVDAIAFDPDPIRGGKIVIQAKRYTNVVGVSAVRDLYGTVVNEGATKGILVTTSNYGSDAYRFAENKPITLMNGANLLYLLERHGYKARIDLKEAKMILNQ